MDVGPLYGGQFVARLTPANHGLYIGSKCRLEEVVTP